MQQFGKIIMKFEAWISGSEQKLDELILVGLAIAVLVMLAIGAKLYVN